MLAANAIDKAFGERRALTGVTLEVGAGEAVLLVGRNGAGKTTLLRIVTGFLDPDAGTVTVDGASMDRERARAQSRLGYLPEHAPAPPELTVRDHLRLRARQKGLGKRTDEAVARVIEAAALATEAGRRIGMLSKGFRQRVGLADALLGEPPLLVLDEPTSGMDPIQTAQMRDHLIEAVGAEGYPSRAGSAPRRALLVSSHAVADLEALATRVAVLRAGSLVAFDTPEALCKATATERLEDAVVKLLGETGATP